MMNVREMLNVEKAKLTAAIREIDVAMTALGGYNGVPKTAPATPAAKREAKAVTKVASKPAGTKRGPDSELTKARKRVASAKRFGKEPLVADLELVAVNAGTMTGEEAAE